MKVKVAQLCLTLCSLMDYTVHGILQARILEWVAYLFSSRSFWPRNRTRVSCIAGGFFTNWAIREALKSLSHDQLFSTPWTTESMNSPGQNTGVGSLSLLQGIFPTQGLNPGLLHFRWILDQLSHKGSPKILEWVAFPFSRGSSWPRNWTGVSCIAGRFFTKWAIREVNASLNTIN